MLPQRDIFKSKNGSKFAKKIAEAVYHSWLAQSDIDARAKTSIEVYSEFQKYLKIFLSYRPMLVVVDHTDRSLELARKHSKLKEHDFACMFYALWCEHFLNKLISSIGYRECLDDISKKKLFRNMTPKSKFEWVCNALKIKRNIKAHLDAIERTSQLRNQFIHYKWESFDVDENEDDIEYIESNLKIEKTISYLKYLEKRYLMGDKKGLLKELWKKHKNRAAEI